MTWLDDVTARHGEPQHTVRPEEDLRGGEEWEWADGLVLVKYVRYVDGPVHRYLTVHGGRGLAQLELWDEPTDDDMRALCLLAGLLPQDGTERRIRELADRTEAMLQDFYTDPVTVREALLGEVAAERERQDAKWGQQNWPDGTSRHNHARIADEARRSCDKAARGGFVTWFHILREEFWEACAEVDPVRLRNELIQVAAVAVSWVEAIDRRAAESADTTTTEGERTP